ncbi:MAG: proton-conducting transporter membrane subunit, partial [Desulfomonilaceae bacterium]
AVMQMICHGISTGALFILVGMIQERTGTRDLNLMGGLCNTIPRIGAVGLLFALASLGLPGLGNFVGEFLVLLGLYQAYPLMSVPAALGIVMAVIYSLRMVNRTFFGPLRQPRAIQDMWPRESALMSSLILLIVWLGLFPQSVLNIAKPSLKFIGEKSGVSLTQKPSWTNSLESLSKLQPAKNRHAK